MRSKIEVVLRRLCLRAEGREPLSGVDAGAQFKPDETADEAVCRNLNAAFLIRLAGESGTVGEEALRYLLKMKAEGRWAPMAAFYEAGLRRVAAEVQSRDKPDDDVGKDMAVLCRLISVRGGEPVSIDLIEAFWRVFFPEGVGLLQNPAEAAKSLRDERKIWVQHLNGRPLEDPVSEILFTSNVLLTVPLDQSRLKSSGLSGDLRRRVEKLEGEPQLFWYDHPIPIGACAEENEVVRGLRALNDAVEFEKRHGLASAGHQLSCALSVSVTHEGLKAVARDYLEESLGEGAGDLPHLRIYAFTEKDTERIQEEILIPAAGRWLEAGPHPALSAVFGVDGEYGRHYTFLKALAAYWQVLVDPAVRATFKIDLDQVFPQEQLVRETGCSAFSHFRTPLWGATGEDSRGRKVRMDMIAGGLVNAEDCGESLFVPDVPLPEVGALTADEWVFHSQLPQAVSTRAEMMTRYDADDLDGRRNCIQRIHVTGGTCGILVEGLRRRRLFTPTFIGRAEDQAYLLSRLFEEEKACLRYVHRPGLIMRHDKHVFAREAVRAAATGKVIGDYIRLLMFTCYARSLPWPMKEIKEAVDPFTGCFISRIPLTIVYLRLALRAARLFKEKDPSGAAGLLSAGVSRLAPLLTLFDKGETLVERRWKEERAAWDQYYDVLDALERALEREDPFALDLKRRATRLMEACRLRIP